MTRGRDRVGGYSGRSSAAIPRPRTVPAYRPATGSVDLDAVRPWVQLCGSCDAGLPMSCTHPPGDYRKPMLALIHEVQRLREENTRLRRDVGK